MNHHPIATPSPRAESLALQIKREAAKMGFDKVGITRATSPDPNGHFLRWLNEGHAGDMAYMARAPKVRLDPNERVPGAKSVIALSVSYACNESSTHEHDPARVGRVARYAHGKDYHRVIKKKLQRLRRFILALEPAARVAPSVDTAPVLERAFSAMAGIAWIGKSTMAIAPDLGTYTFLATLTTTLELAPDEPMPDRCGSCTACLDACPTGAIVAPYILDARRCISYWTLEHRGAFDATTPRLFGWVAGCDICQEVCPWNKWMKNTREQRFLPKPELALPNVTEWKSDRSAIERAIAGTALTYTGAASLQRNAERVLEENADPATITAR